MGMEIVFYKIQGGNESDHLQKAQFSRLYIMENKLYLLLDH
jgi:hypothetical protein